MSGHTFATFPSLRGKGVLITGGASGIGRSMVEAFHEQGANVAFIDIDNGLATTLVNDLRSRKTPAESDAHYLRCDVTDTAALHAAVADANGIIGGLNVLINSAADDTRHSLDELTSEYFDDCIAINLKHQLFATQAAYPLIAANGGGSIICLGSISWLNNTTAMIGYTTAKAAIHGMVRSLARQLGPKNIRVNALLPGWTMTERQRSLWIDATAESEIDRAQCLPGRVKPIDVARLALFLAADDSGMCTQQMFVVDGGWI